MPAISGGTNAWAVLLVGSGASRTMLTTPPAAPARIVGSARIAAGAIARDVPRTATRGCSGDGREGNQSNCRCDQMPNQELATFDRQAVGAIRLIDFLRQRLHHFEAQQEQHQRGADDCRSRAANGHRLKHAGHCRKHGHAHQTGRGEAGDAGDAPARYRLADPARNPDPWSASRLLLVELPAQQDHGSQILHRDGEAQLCDEAAASGESVERRLLQHADTDQQHDDGDEWHSEIDRVLTPAPHRQAARRVGRSGEVPRQRRALPGDAGEAERRGDPQRQPDGMGDQRRARPQQCGGDAERRAAGGPGDRRSR